MPVSTSDDLDAFVAHAGLGSLDLRLREDGPLCGLDFALKDFFDLAGVATGAGSPDWLASHPVPATTASVVLRVLEAGGRLVGKTHTDELAWSLDGENHHYGAPRNPAAPGRIPGGSSSGSAVATAGGLVDFAIGSDTGGSVRLPASYCGIYGIRTTHGRIPLDGAVPLAPSYDTAGWFARDATLMKRVGRAIFGPAAKRSHAVRALVMADDLFAAAGDEVRAALRPAVDLAGSVIGPATVIELAGSELPAWRNTFRIVQSAEVLEAHGEWVLRAKPNFGPRVGARFAAAAELTQAEIDAAKADRLRIAARVLSVVGDDTAILLPTAPGVAPPLGRTDAQADTFRARSIELLCAAGHAGLPQISMPLGRIGGLPVGLSVIGPRNGDEALLDLAEAIEAAGRDPAAVG